MLKQDKLPILILEGEIFGPLNLSKIEMVPISSNITKIIDNVNFGGLKVLIL
jgi:hypothetical protein